jgi:hypothetical protein
VDAAACILLLKKYTVKFHYYLNVLFVLIVTSCTKDATLVITEPPIIDSSAVITHVGTFVNGPHGRVQGTVQVVRSDSALAVVLGAFSSSAGPDLHVYLSKEVQPVNFIDLGSLRSTSGMQAYSIPGAPDLTQYRYILVHCKAYNHLFGSASLVVF